MWLAFKHVHLLNGHLLAGSPNLVGDPESLLYNSWMHGNCITLLSRLEVDKFHSIHLTCDINQPLWSCWGTFHSCRHHLNRKRMVIRGSRLYFEESNIISSGAVVLHFLM